MLRFGAGTSRAGDIRGYFAGYQDAFKCGGLSGAGLLRGVSVDYSERVAGAAFKTVDYSERVAGRRLR